MGWMYAGYDPIYSQPYAAFMPPANQHFDESESPEEYSPISPLSGIPGSPQWSTPTSSVVSESTGEADVVGSGWPAALTAATTQVGRR